MELAGAAAGLLLYPFGPTPRPSGTAVVSLVRLVLEPFELLLELRPNREKPLVRYVTASSTQKTTAAMSSTTDMQMSAFISLPLSSVLCVLAAVAVVFPAGRWRFRPRNWLSWRYTE